MNSHLMVFIQDTIYLKDVAYVINLDEFPNIGNN